MKPFIFSMFMMLAGLQASAEDTTLHIKTQLEGVGDTLEVKIDDMLIPYIGSGFVNQWIYHLRQSFLSGSEYHLQRDRSGHVTF